MLLSLAQWLQTLSPEFGSFRVFQYLTFRAVMAAVTALLLGLVAGPFVIRRLTELKIGQPIRDYAMQTHLSKSGTPTMGGVLILLCIAISTLLWADLSNRFVWIVLLVTLGFGAIGWADDWRKVVHKDPEGMRSREKYFWQSVVGLVAALYLVLAFAQAAAPAKPATPAVAAAPAVAPAAAAPAPAAAPAKAMKAEKAHAKKKMKKAPAAKKAAAQ